MVTRVAIIPARGGSRRIPRKNIHPFCGKPMLAWTIEAALESRCFDRVIVSTEDQEIADIAVRYGATVPFLRDAAFDDQAHVSEVVIRTLQRLGPNIAEQYAVTAMLMPNCPFRDAADVARAIERFGTQGLDFQISCTDFSFQNPWWAHRILPDRRAQPLFPEAMKQRSQDLDPLYAPTGALWIAKTAALIEAGSYLVREYSYEPLSWLHAIDIDTLEDLELAQRLAAIERLSETSAPALTFRKAESDDSELLLQWRNDPSTRASSVDPTPVRREEHQRWLGASLQSPDRFLYIGLHQGTPVGTVRFDRIDPNLFELSWTLAPEQRGKGLGRALVQQATGLVPNSLRSRIKSDNEISQRVARAAGFVSAGSENGLLLFTLLR